MLYVNQIIIRTKGIALYITININLPNITITNVMESSLFHTPTTIKLACLTLKKKKSMPKTKFGEETNEPTQPLKSQNKRAYTLKFSPNIKGEMSIRYRSLKNKFSSQLY